MVNVPGRSKGCQTCRKRKIKCTLERPECAQCMKSGRVCLGYQRDRIFVHSDANTVAEKSRGQVKPRVITTSSPSTDTSWSSPSSIDSRFDLEVDPDASLSLSSTALRNYVLSDFISGYKGLYQLRNASTPNWLRIIPTHANPTKALETAAFAVSLGTLGDTLQNRDMLSESLRLYTRGLNDMQAALYDPKLMYEDDTLAACMLLAMYEIFQCPSNNRKAYVNHANGCAKLVQLRGPAAHCSGLGHSIFQGFRFMGVSLITPRYQMSNSFTVDPRGTTHKAYFLIRTRMESNSILESNKEPRSKVVGSLA
ncbi:hypothetical protein BT63DRAFT_194719 [Microthyrium microscopicum]|uniref:Zn(2)-C6 fungal-type domain-containing protein n=1 Tax=Microthyrium microscopicum TaxID=703497 RepID=A0A6A6ULN5_9PEZI|nr:hypothetical protein BT63DRAFT_194719 [Microthyrium microscopicum]